MPIQKKLSEQTINEIRAYFSNLSIQGIIDELHEIPILLIEDQGDIDFNFYQNPIHNLRIVCELLKECRKAE